MPPGTLSDVGWEWGADEHIAWQNAMEAKRGNITLAIWGDGERQGLRKVSQKETTQETNLEEKKILPYRNQWDCIPELIYRSPTDCLGTKNCPAVYLYVRYPRMREGPMDF